MSSQVGELLQFLREWNTLDCSIGHLDEDLVKIEMTPLAETEERKRSIVHRSQMAENVNRTILAWRDLLIELFLGESEKDVSRPPDCEPPVGESGLNHQLFNRHANLLLS
jgi:hypothetical protein